MRVKHLFRNKIAILISMILVLAVLTGEMAGAYTVAATGSTTIAPTAAQFKAAKSPMYISKTQTIKGTLDAYKMDVYHYECQQSGYYQIYTTGSLDTVGAVYEEQNTLTGTKYVQRAFNDVGRIARKSDNFSMVVKMDKHEDYYICVRGYSGLKGSYTLNIEPNQDKTSWQDNGVWTSKKAKTVNSATKKIYLTKEQAIVAYWVLDGDRTIVGDKYNYSTDQLVKMYQKGGSSKTTAVNSFMTMLSTTIGLASKSDTVSLIATAVSFFFTEAYSFNEATKFTLAKDLRVASGISETVYVSSMTSKWTIKSGAVMTETYTGNVGATHKRTFKAYNGGLMTGETWNYGTWTYE